MKLVAVNEEAAYYARGGEDARFEPERFIRGLLGADTAIRLVAFLSDPNTAAAAASMRSEAEGYALRCWDSPRSLIGYGELRNAADGAGVAYAGDSWEPPRGAVEVNLSFVAGLRAFACALLRLAALGRGLGDASEAVVWEGVDADTASFFEECDMPFAPDEMEWGMSLRKEYAEPLSLFMCLYGDAVLAAHGEDLLRGSVSLHMKHFPDLYVYGAPGETELRGACSIVALAVLYALDTVKARKLVIREDGRIAESEPVTGWFAAGFAEALQNAVLSDRVSLCEVCGNPIICKSELAKTRRSTCSERCRTRKHKEKGVAQNGDT